MKNSETVQSLQRGFSGFEAAFVNGSICASELAEQLGINRSSAYRLLTTVEMREYLWQSDENKRFYPNYEKLYALMPGAWDWVNLAEPSLKELGEQTGRTANIGILDGSDIVYLRSRLPHPDEPSYIHPGTRNPGYATALGKAILAYRTQTFYLNDYIQLGLIRPSKRFPIDAETLSQHLTQIRHNEYAIDDEVFGPNIRCIAAPIFDASHEVIAAVGISGTVTNITVQLLPEQAKCVISAAKRITSILEMAGYTSR